MAQRSPVVPVSDDPSRVVAWPQSEVPVVGVNEAQTQDHENDVAEEVQEVLHAGVDASARSFRSAQRRLTQSAEELKSSIREFADKRPLHFVGVIAGVAFVTGVALRIWRSNSYEQ
jgi:ElaB/YqjD/DUF883 family membrane-anchored ribosome-binding protein